MKKQSKNSVQKALEVIKSCQNQEEALHRLDELFGEKPAKLDVICWFTFNALPNITQPYPGYRRNS